MVSSTSAARSSSGNGGGSGDREHLDLAVGELDLPGGELGVDGALRAGPRTVPVTAQDVLAAHVHRSVDDALQQARVVAQVDEGQVLAVLAATAPPSRTPSSSDRCRSDRGSPHMWVRMAVLELLTGVSWSRCRFSGSASEIGVV